MAKLIGRAIIIIIPLLIAAAFVLIIMAMVAMRPQPERGDSAPRPVAVFAEPVRAEATSLRVTAQGEVRPRTEISLTAQLSGRIAYVSPSFVEGGFFEAGEVLVRLESADYRLAVTRAEALVAQRRQQLLREEVEAELAREEWEALGEGQASPLTLRQPQLADARAQLAGAESSLEEARLNLARTEISAPFSGRVRMINADLGQFVGPGTSLGQVFSTDVVQIRLPLTDSELGLLGIPLAYQAGDRAERTPVSLSATVAGEPRVWEGHVARTGSAIDPQTRTLSVIVEVEDPYGAVAEAAGAPLAVGLFVEADMEGRRLENALVLPRSALRGADEVYIAEPDGTLSVETVQVVSTTPDRVVVASGVEPGEYVITSPVRAAATGMAVRAINGEGEPIFETAESEPARGEEGEAEEAAIAGEGGRDTAQPG